MTVHGNRSPYRARWLIFIGGLVALVGCTPSHTIGAGRWVLNATGTVHDLRDRRTLGDRYMKDLPVDVVVGWNVDPRSGKDIETVEIYLIHGDAERADRAAPMTGTIRIGQDARFTGPTLLVIGQDDDYDIELRGPVVDANHVHGELWAVSRDSGATADGTPRHSRGLGVKGRFTLVRVPE